MPDSPAKRGTAQEIPGRLRPLNLPRIVEVGEENGRPAFVRLGGYNLRVAAIQECWRIDDEWWRRAVSRLYFQLLLESGDVVTVFKDLVRGEWFQQQY